MVITLGDVLVIIYANDIRHFERGKIKIHLSIPNGNVLEGLDCRLEGLHRNTDLFLSILIPVFFEKFGVLASSLLNLQIRMSFKATNHFVDAIFIVKLLIKFKEA